MAVEGSCNDTKLSANRAGEGHFLHIASVGGDGGHL